MRVTPPQVIIEKPNFMEICFYLITCINSALGQGSMFRTSGAMPHSRSGMAPFCCVSLDRRSRGRQQPVPLGPLLRAGAPTGE